MQRVQAAALRWSFRLVDAGVVVGAFVLTAWAREAARARWSLDLLPGEPVLQVVTLQNQLGLIVLALPVWMLALHLNGAYDDLRRLRRDLLFIRLVRAVSVAMVGLLLIQFVVPPATPTSRTFLLGFAVVSAVMLFGVRVTLGSWGRFAPQGTYDILVVGSAAEAVPFLEVLQRHRDWGLRIAGVLRPDDDTLSSSGEVPVLGTVSDLPRVLATRNVAQVFMTGRVWSVETLRFVADTCEEVGVTFSMDANFLGLSVARAEVQDFEGWGVLSFSSTPPDAEALVIKRGIDLFGSGLALLVASPLLLVVAALIKLDGGPVFFAQERAGLYGRRFRMYKFRSMSVDAEARKPELEHLNEMSGPVFKMREDPRITAVGRWLRRLSIDELPQFYNVLRGEMSLGGPRPPIPAEVARYERWQMRRLSMKPGITCIWQVSGRNEVDFDTWMRLDLEYIDNWSLFLDLKLLLKTVPVVLVGSGAR